MTTPPTAANVPAPPARGKTFTIEAERRLKEGQERLEQFTQRACARRGQPWGTKDRPVPATEYGVMTAMPGAQAAGGAGTPGGTGPGKGRPRHGPTAHVPAR